MWGRFKSGLVLAAIFITFLILVGHTPLLKAQQKAVDNTCTAIKPYETKVNINMLQMDPVYDWTKSEGEILRNMEKYLPRWLRENAIRLLWQANDLEVGGTAFGGWGIAPEYKFDNLAVDRYGVYYCPIVKEINVDILYRSLVFVPTDVKQDECLFQVIVDHIGGHETIARSVLDAYTAKMKTDLVTLSREMEASAGYMKRKEIADALATMKDGLNQTIMVFFSEAIQKEILRRGLAFDSKENIDAVRLVRDKCALGADYVPPGVKPEIDIQISR